MKLKQYLAFAVIMIFCAHFVTAIEMNGRVAMPWFDRLLQPFGIDQPVHAQASGYKTWNNIQTWLLSTDTADSSSGGTGLQSLGSGATFTLPANPAVVWWIDCQLAYSQATAAVSDGIGLSYSNAPTSSTHQLFVSTTAATAPLGGVITSITNTSSNAILPAFTPGATATSYSARLSGIVKMPATTQDTTVQLYLSQATQGDVMTLKAGSGCMWHSVN
jgi:hypothetical protein